MKTPKEISKLAAEHFPNDVYAKEEVNLTPAFRVGYWDGYEQCQENMVKEIQSLIYDYKSDILKLEKEFRDSSSVLIVEKIVTLQDVIHDLYKTLNKQH